MAQLQEVASVSKGDKKFLEALKGPVYTRIHQALYSQNTTMYSPSLENLSSTPNVVEEQRIEAADRTNEKNEHDDSVTDSEAEHVVVVDPKVLNEIEACEENGTVGNETLDISVQKSGGILSNEIEEDQEVISPEQELHVRATNEIAYHFEVNGNIGISSAVQEALGTLEKAISLIRDLKIKHQNNELDTKEQAAGNLKESKEEFLSKPEQLKGENRTCEELSRLHSAEPTLPEPGNISNSHGSR